MRRSSVSAERPGLLNRRERTARPLGIGVEHRLGRLGLHDHHAQAVRDHVVHLAREAGALLRHGRPRLGLALALEPRGALLAAPPSAGCARAKASPASHATVAIAPTNTRSPGPAVRVRGHDHRDRGHEERPARHAPGGEPLQPEDGARAPGPSGRRPPSRGSNEGRSGPRRRPPPPRRRGAANGNRRRASTGRVHRAAPTMRTGVGPSICVGDPHLDLGRARRAGRSGRRARSRSMKRRNRMA